MIKYLKLKNYKSLVDFDANFMGSNNEPKKLVIIYGENGAGKSNFISAIKTIKDSASTMFIKNVVEKNLTSKLSVDEIGKKLKNVPSTSKIIEECKTINSIEPMSIEVGFRTNTNPQNYRDGVYKIVYDNTKIIEESLSYQLQERMTKCFEYINGSIYINDNIFINKNYAKEIKEKFLQYKGIHSLTSIVLSELNEKDNQYILAGINKKIMAIIFNNFFALHVYVNTEDQAQTDLFDPINSNSFPIDIFEGLARNNYRKRLDITSDILTRFFNLTNSDIAKVTYDIEETPKGLKYKLFYDKVIGGELRHIPYNYESTGIKKTTSIAASLIMATSGCTIFDDEIDSNIHESLLKNMISSVYATLKNGQLFLTSHSTILFECDEIPNDAFYVFDIDSEGNKKLIDIQSNSPVRIQKNNNRRDNFLNNRFGGVPYLSEIDFLDLSKENNV